MVGRGGREDAWATGRPNGGRARRRRGSVIATVTTATVLLTATLALADVIQAETDGDALHAPHPVSISANQQVGTTVEYPFSAVIQDTNGSTNNVFSRPGDAVRVTIARSGAWVATPDGTPNRFDLHRLRRESDRHDRDRRAEGRLR